MTKEQEYRDKLIKLTDMIHSLPMIVTIRHEAQYVNLEATKWNEFMKQVAELGLDGTEETIK